MVDTRAGGASFFISYTGADRGWAEWIAWQIEEAGYRAIIQAWDFNPGSHFVGEMQRTSEQAACTVAVLSRGYLNSVIAAEEWQAAWAADPDGRLGRLLVVRVKDCDRPGLLRQVVSVDIFGVPQQVAQERLIAALRRRRAKPATEPGYPGRPTLAEGAPAFPGLPSVREAHDTGGLAAQQGSRAAEGGKSWQESRNPGQRPAPRLVLSAAGVAILVSASVAVALSLTESPGQPALSQSMPVGTAIQAASGVIALYRTSHNGIIWGTDQRAVGGSYAPWLQLSAGTTFTSQPASFRNSAGLISLYALTSTGTIMSSAQSDYEGPFSPWQPIGSGTPHLATPPDLLLTSQSLIAMYAVDINGIIWGTKQKTADGAFTRWQQVSPPGVRFKGQVSSSQNSAGMISLYALTSTGTIMSSTHSGIGGPTSTWQPIGSGGPDLATPLDLITPPDVLLLSNGVAAVYAVDINGIIWGTKQKTAGGAFTRWQQVSPPGVRFKGQVSSSQNSVGMISLYALTSTGTIMSSTHSGIGGPTSTWQPIGSGGPDLITPPDLVTPPDVLLLSNGVVVVFAADNIGEVWGTNQNAVGAYVPWQHL